MALLDKQKEKVANYRLAWGISLTSLLGMMAFIFNSVNKLPFLKTILILIAGSLMILIVLYLTWKLNIETEKLEDI